MKLRIATRRSALALWQAEHVKTLLERTHADLTVELLPVVTEGDRIQDRPLSEVGGKGLFIKELEVAMNEGRADLAVHSMKDVPWDMPPGFTLAAVLNRADPRDAFLSTRHAGLTALPVGARVGTSSLRRQCLLRSARPDLQIISLRGNVDTRLRKLDNGDYDAIVLAAAGLTRLGLAARITEYLDPLVSLPAVGQGAIGIECRDQADLVRWFTPLDHAATHTCLKAERAFAQALTASCTSPIAAHAQLHGSTLTMSAMIGSPDGLRVVRGELHGHPDSAQQLGTDLAHELLARGGRDILAGLAGTH